MSPLDAGPSILPRDILYIHTVLHGTIMTLPSFDPPQYDELREWWKTYRGNTDVLRLILEVQSQRYAIAEMRMMADAARRQAAEEAPELLAKGRALPKLHRRLEQELKRGGRIYPEPKLSKAEAERIKVPPRRYD